MIRKVWSVFLDILFPRICLHCRRYLGAKNRYTPLCEDCFNNVDTFKTAFWTDRGGRFLAVGPYEDNTLKTVIHELKYRGIKSALNPIEKWIGHYFADINAREWIDKDTLIIPIPLHRSRLRQRGFNQAELIANVLGEYFDLEVELHALKRIKNTKAQVEIREKNKRESNVRGCFAADAGKILNKPVMLVDDVYTSGSTIREAEAVLRKAGARSVNVFVLAKA